MSRRPPRWSTAGAVLVTLATLPTLLGVPATARAGDDGQALLAKRDYEGAATAFLAAVRKDPADAAARRGAAEALLGLGRAQEAVEQAEAGLEIEGHGRDAALWLALARGYLAIGDASPDYHPDTKNIYADAIAKAATALRHDPSLNLARVVQAQALRKRATEGDFENAAALLKEALERSPGDFDALFETGELALREKRPADAVAAFEAAIAADPTSAMAQLRLGLAQAYLARWDASVEAFRRAAILDPRDRAALGYIGKYAGKKAPDVYRSVVKESPKNPWAHAYLAWSVGAISKDEAGAVKSLKDALALAPNDARLLAWTGTIHETIGRKEDARRAWKKALEMDASADVAWNALLAHATDPSNGVKVEERELWIEFLAKIRPDDPWLWNNAGLIYRDLEKDYARSLQCYLKAAELKPDDQGIVNDTGLIYQFHGKEIGQDPKKCLPYYEAVLRLVEEDGQDPLMGYRDTLENLALYYGPPGNPAAHEPNPELALRYGEARNERALLDRLPKEVAQPSGRAAAAVAWAKKELEKQGK